MLVLRMKLDDKINDSDVEIFVTNTEDLLEQSHEAMDFVLSLVKSSLNYDKSYIFSEGHVIMQIGTDIARFLRGKKPRTVIYFKVEHERFGEEILKLTIKKSVRQLGIRNEIVNRPAKSAHC